MSNAKFDRSLKRNLDELARSILNLKAIDGLDSADTYHGVDFIRLSRWALFDDCMAHAVRVFDKHRGTASFWYLHRCQPSEVENALAALDLETADLKDFSASLKLVRNKTHFHIDLRSVSNPKAVWQRADLKKAQFELLVRKTFEALNSLHQARFGNEFWLPDYDGSDARAIAKFAESLSLGAE